MAAMVVFDHGEPMKSDYRKFKIRTIEGADDPASIYEAVKRRYTATQKDKLAKPDLILIDGGITQVRAAKKALAEAKMNTKVIGLAKKNEEIYLPEVNSPLILPKDSPGLLLLRRIRDEVHRFVISYHRSKRTLQ